MVINLKFVSFGIGSQRFGLPYQLVERIVQVVEIRPLPQTPDFISGIINFHGTVIPVITPRILFGIPEKGIELSDQLMIVNTSSRKLALLVDSTYEVFDIKENEIIKSDKILSGMKYLKGVIKLEDEMILISDIDEFLSDEELKRLEIAMDQMEKTN